MKLEYAIEAAVVGTFMVSASLVAVGVEHPDSPLRAMVADPLLRRMLIGIGMGLTAILLIYSPMGRRSGAHMNPAVTLTFWRLGRVENGIAAAYAVSQFLGAIAGLGLAFLILGNRLVDVSFIATRPGPAGALVAFVAEAAISFAIMAVVLTSTNATRLMPYTGLFVGALVAVYITVEEPLSGMSMNPARTLAPWVVGGIPTPLWVYFTAPALGMLLASELFVWRHGLGRVRCAKLQHPRSGECVFNCESRLRANADHRGHVNPAPARRSSVAAPEGPAAGEGGTARV
jgi:aquaporin Z